jgi:hypothetical protein
MLGNYRVAAQLVASRVVLSSTELVNRGQNVFKPTQHDVQLVWGVVVVIPRIGASTVKH